MSVWVRVGAVLDTEGGRVFSRLFARMVRCLLPPVLRIYLQTRLEPEQRRLIKNLYLRGSLLDPVDFNPVYSDWDLGIICFDSNERRGAHDPLFFEITRVISDLKTILPALGEIEIYFESDIAELNHWFGKWGQLYSDLRHLRKIGWLRRQMDIMRSCTKDTEYHFVKARRALQMCYRRLGLEAMLASGEKGWDLAIRSVLQKHAAVFREDRTDLEFAPGGKGGESMGAPYRGPDIYQLYLDREFGEETVLSRREMIRLFALLPPGFMPEAISDESLRIRIVSRAGEACYALALIEELILAAVERGATEPSSVSMEWWETLTASKRQLKEQCGRSFDVG